LGRMIFFTMGHLMAIANHTFFGYRLAKWMYFWMLSSIRRNEPIVAFAKNLVLCSYPYTLVVSRRITNEIEKVVYSGERYLPNEPYYNSLFQIGALYGYSYTGDIARAEIYCQKLRQHHEDGKLLRYRPISRIMDKLPFALRGYGHLIQDSFFEALAQHREETCDPVINSQFYRVSAVIALFLGKKELAKELIPKARRQRQKTKSFMAWEAFDSRVEEIATRPEPFNPAKDKLLIAATEFRTPPHLGALLVEFIELLSDALSKDSDWFSSQIMERLCRHMQWDRFTASETVSIENTTAPCIRIGRKYYTMEGLPESRIPYVREQLAALTPVVVMLTHAREEQQRANELEKTAALGRLAAQVAHDIRSPLAALDMTAANLSMLPEDKRGLMRSAISRIRDIANNLLDQNRVLIKGGATRSDQPAPSVEPLSIELISNLADSLLSEKRMQFKTRHGITIEAQMDDGCYGLFAKIQPEEFRRTLSNLINNSMEALPESGGRVELTFSGTEKDIELKIADNGKGIPADILPKLMQLGHTFGKKGGSGLGLYHARASIASWGGEIRIESQLVKGTIVVIKLPRAQAPAWFIPRIELRPNFTVVIVDDDSTIHQVWEERLKGLSASSEGVKLLHFTTDEDFLRWYQSPEKDLADEKLVLYLVDYELIGSKRTGLEIINELKLADHSILVTGRFEERQIVELCLRDQVGLLPKAMAGFIPILFKTASVSRELNLKDESVFLLRQEL
jgi:signal transduction histidine kinase